MKFYVEKKMNYEAGRFSDLSELSLGKDLWQFLNRKDNIIRMETATELNRTAAESVSKILLDEFGDDVKVNRVKQMIGHMIRQIMESRGYQMGTQNVKVSIQRLFTKASRYVDGSTKTTKLKFPRNYVALNVNSMHMGTTIKSSFNLCASLGVFWRNIVLIQQDKW